jgi:hypothetical protein
LTPLNDACLELAPDDSVDARLTCRCPVLERLAVWLAFVPWLNGLAYACEEAGDPPLRDELTDRFTLEFRLIVELRVTVFPLRVTLVLRVTLALRLIDTFLFANAK